MNCLKHLLFVAVVNKGGMLGLQLFCSFRRSKFSLARSLNAKFGVKFLISIYLSSGQTLGVKAQRFRGHTSPHRNVKEKNNTQNMVLSTSGFDPVEEQTKRRRSLQQQQPIFEKVFGVDEREKVTSHMQYPYSAVGWIAFLDEFGYASAGCTGTLVSQRVVLTAAHCLYVQSDKATTEFPEGMSAGGYEFYAGRSGNIHLPVAKAIDAVVTRKYAELNDEYDYAVLVLDRDVGSETGWMGIGVNCEDGQKPISVNIAGYPYDKSENNDVMYKSSCDNVVIDQCANVTGFFSYLCDTEKGMSGAPVWVHYENVQKREIRGIHVVGRRQLNQGVYISPKTFNFITKEINASTYL
eukprot:TRINITY_DN2192_c0_g1_i3.p1 TRINITY_DN2192_c0_g1~~TRINITY_DN2192_c0_g1_i3.p1  ORF type:complete len:352 (-),score=53.30 TRINITY_DN2192_c0_g1_i3:1654-2709(-)